MVLRLHLRTVGQAAAVVANTPREAHWTPDALVLAKQRPRLSVPMHQPHLESANAAMVQPCNLKSWNFKLKHTGSGLSKLMNHSINRGAALRVGGAIMGCQWAARPLMAAGEGPEGGARVPQARPRWHVHDTHFVQLL